ncbi:MAG: VWA domain-containing protein [Candidatus Riflebacteria bacterium]|nr:VWA domain-containing protein [Candidatus Riflebacteria bacterium]
MTESGFPWKVDSARITRALRRTIWAAGVVCWLGLFLWKPAAALPAEPVTPVFVIDTSGSMIGQGSEPRRNIMPAVVAEACRFVDALPAGSPLIVATFHSGLQSWKDFSLTDPVTRNLARKHIQGLQATGMSTWIYDALHHLTARLTGWQRSTGSRGKFVIYLFTDGQDNDKRGIYSIEKSLQQLSDGFSDRYWLYYISLGIQPPAEVQEAARRYNMTATFLPPNVAPSLPKEVAEVRLQPARGYSFPLAWGRLSSAGVEVVRTLAVAVDVNAAARQLGPRLRLVVADNPENPAVLPAGSGVSVSSADGFGKQAELTPGSREFAVQLRLPPHSKPGLYRGAIQFYRLSRDGFLLLGAGLERSPAQGMWINYSFEVENPRGPAVLKLGRPSGAPFPVDFGELTPGQQLGETILLSFQGLPENVKVKAELLAAVGASASLRPGHHVCFGDGEGAVRELAAETGKLTVVVKGDASLVPGAYQAILTFSAPDLELQGAGLTATGAIPIVFTAVAVDPPEQLLLKRVKLVLGTLVVLYLVLLATTPGFRGSLTDEESYESQHLARFLGARRLLPRQLRRVTVGEQGKARIGFSGLEGKGVLFELRPFSGREVELQSHSDELRVTDAEGNEKPMSRGSRAVLGFGSVISSSNRRIKYSM